jgi:hypothetical protein
MRRSALLALGLVAALLSFGLVVGLPGQPAATGQTGQDDDNGAAAAGCPATPLEASRPPGENGVWDNVIKQDGIWVGFGLGDGKVASISWPAKRDGSISMKYAWWRKRSNDRARGKLRVLGERIPTGESLLRFHQSPGFTHPKVKFVASSIVYRSAGCWRINAKAGKARLSFVIWVVDSNQAKAAAAAK